MEDSNIGLFSKSRYFLKYDAPKAQFYEYDFYFLDSVTNDEINEFKKYLKENYSILKMEFISKEEAAQEAANIFGTNTKELFDKTVFPSRLNVQTETKVNVKKIKNQFKKFLEEAMHKDVTLGTVIFRIET